MTKENKKLALVSMFVVVLIMLVLFCVDQYRKHKALDDYSKYAPIQIEAPATTQQIDVNPAINGKKTSADADTTLQEYPFRIAIRNMNELSETPLPDKALWIIEANLNRYFNYYLDNGTNYYADFLPDTYISNKNLPCFTIHVEGLEMDIVCTWYTSRGFYNFTSDFNPNGE